MRHHPSALTLILASIVANSVGGASAQVPRPPEGRPVPGACQDRAIESGQRVSDQLRNGRCQYTFTGQVGDLVTIAMNGLSSGLDPRLRLFAPGGEQEAFDDNSGGGRNSLIRGHRLRQAGRYTLRAESRTVRHGKFELSLSIVSRSSLSRAARSARQGLGTTRPAPPPVARPGTERVAGRVTDRFRRPDFVAGVRDLPVPPSTQPALAECTPGDIEPGEPISAKLAGDKVCEYTFTGQAGDRVKLGLAPLGAPFEPWVALVDPFGRLELSSAVPDSRGHLVIQDHMLLATGTYKILAGAPGEPAQAAFRLSLLFRERRGALPASCGGVLPSEETAIFARLANPGDTCVYSLTGGLGQTAVTVTMTRLEGDLEPWLKVTGSGGTEILGSAGSGESRVEFPLARADSYQIQAGSFAGRTAGVFKLSVDPVKLEPIFAPSCGDQNLRPGQPITKLLLKNVCPYFFDGNAGDRVTLRMDAVASGIDPVIALIDPGGQEIAFDDDSGGNGNSLIEGHRLLRTGRYEVHAQSYGASEGEFSLLLELAAGGG